MKSNRLSGWMALLMAVLMVMSCVVPAVAETIEDKQTYDAALSGAIDSFVNGTPETQYALLMGVESDEAREALLSKLTQEQMDALTAYAITQQEPVELKTVTFTAAGPFMPAVNVAPKLRMMMMATARDASSGENTADGLELSKTVKDNGDGTYTITLESYVTGTVTTTTVTKTTPVDIVLVLDQSGSMAYDFAGNSTSTDSDRRQYAMKQAVNNFITAVNAKYSAEADHRMAIVTYGSDASTLQGWTTVDTTGMSTLQSAISGLPKTPSGATNVAAGMSKAETLMGTGYNYTGANTNRQKVVILFTDGVPTTSSEFDTTVATNAIASAKNLKAAGVTVYSVGIFGGANPDQLFGSEYKSSIGKTTSCDGSVGSKWGGLSIFDFSGSIDFDAIDIASANRFLNYVSSNYKTASSIGIKMTSFNIILVNHQVREITEVFDKTGSGYYLTAADSTSLNTIFQTISDNIQTGQASMDLGSTTVVKDVVTPYFDMPANTSDIKVYTANCSVKATDGSFTFGERTASNLTPTVSGQTVEVTGFDYTTNYVAIDATTNVGRGKKLIIEFTVKPMDGFLGGNGVPTNGADSGIYTADGTKVDTFTVPDVDVQIPTLTVTAGDKNVYLLGTVTKEQMYADAVVTINGMAYNLDQFKALVATDAFVGSSIDITSNFQSAYQTDGDYTVTVTISPNATGTEKAEIATVTKHINVFKPVLTFKDAEATYLEQIADQNVWFNTNDFVREAWEHGTDPFAAANMTGAKPTIDLTYAPKSTFVEGGKVVATADVPVDVTAKIGDTSITPTYKHDSCTISGCSWQDPTTPGVPAFLVHIKDVLSSLTITKAGADTTLDPNQSFLFTVTGGNLQTSGLKVTVTGNGSVTVSGLTVGQTYTITEESGWSWRYTPPTSAPTITLVADAAQNTVTITNNRSETKWLDGSAPAKENVAGTAQ